MTRARHIGVRIARGGLAVMLVALGAVASAGSDRQQELVRLVRQDCGSCHGMSLNGGLGPALLPDTLRGKPLDSLVATVLRGRPGTPMPGWAPFLDEAEARWIVEQLVAGFPAEPR